MTWVMVNLVSVRLEMVLVSVQDRCMVCTERTIGSEIVLDTPDLAPRWLGHVKSSFSLFGDGVSVSVR
jgi:hypothetical protein